jgi:hypothetical protein
MCTNIEDHLDQVMQAMDSEIESVGKNNNENQDFSVAAQDIERLAEIRASIQSHLDSVKTLSSEMDSILTRIDTPHA